MYVKGHHLNGLQVKSFVRGKLELPRLHVVSYLSSSLSLWQGQVGVTLCNTVP